jgi:hypothetical protein
VCDAIAPQGRWMPRDPERFAQRSAKRAVLAACVGSALSAAQRRSAHHQRHSNYCPHFAQRAE